MANFSDIRGKKSSESIVRDEIPATPIQRTYRPREPLDFKKIGIFFIVFAILVAGVYFGVSAVRASREFTIELSSGLDRASIAGKIGEALGWSDKEKNVFAGTYAQMHWMAFNGEITKIFVDKFKWGNADKETFLTQAVKYIEPKYDFLSQSYIPGTYSVKGGASMAEISDILIARVKEEKKDDIAKFLNETLKQDAVNEVALLVRKEGELLPDLVPLPAKDVVVEKVGADVLLRFSTIYFNQGKGPLELIADPRTKGIRSDIVRDVLQRIYLVGGGYRDKVSGTFLWHQEHLHYHFDDFVIYDLEAVDVKNPPDLSGVRTKSTFCIRDVSVVEESYPIENRMKDAKYKICGKELQGISVGWGDTYFYSYVDQNLNVTDLPSGKYRLTFIANPEKRFDESNMDNNRSSIVFDLNMENLTVKILEESPQGLPAVEHIYEEQVFPNR